MSTTNFWAIIVAIVGGLASYYDLKTDNRVRDLVIETNAKVVTVNTAKIIVIDEKLTDTRELLLKIDGKLDGVVKEQSRVARALDRSDRGTHPN